MAYNVNLAHRLQAALEASPNLVEKKMFGGIGYLINGNMACGVHGDGLIVRVGAAEYAAALTRPHTRVFDLTGRPMAGWLVVDPPGCETEQELQEWVERGVKYALSLPVK